MSENNAVIPAAPAQEKSALVDIRGASALLGISPWSVRALINRKELPIVQVGNRFYLSRKTLLKWVERSEAVR